MLPDPVYHHKGGLACLDGRADERVALQCHVLEENETVEFGGEPVESIVVDEELG